MDTQLTRQEPPQHVVDRITLLGGLNIYGKPNFRVIWGGNRTHLVGGMFKKILVVASHPVVTQVAEMRTLLKYNPHRWHLERWRGPEYYGSREDWYRDSWDEESQLHTMGDYPTEGDYEHVFYLGMCSHMKPGDTDWCMLCQVTSGEYIPLEENVYLLERQIYALKLSDDVSKSEERAALFLREDKKRQVRRKIVEDRVRGALRPNLALQPTSWQDGTRCAVPEASLRVPAFLPKQHLGFRQSTHAMPAKKQSDLDKENDDAAN